MNVLDFLQMLLWSQCVMTLMHNKYCLLSELLKKLFEIKKIGLYFSSDFKLVFAIRFILILERRSFDSKVIY